MNIEWVRRHCLSFPHSTETVQWGNNLVFKVGGKIYAILALEPGEHWISFKCAPEDFVELTERPGIVPAPYLARAHWIALEQEDALPPADLKRLLRQAYDLVVAKLPKKAREAIAGRPRSPRGGGTEEAVNRNNPPRLPANPGKSCSGSFGSRRRPQSQPSPTSRLCPYTGSVARKTSISRSLSPLLIAGCLIMAPSGAPADPEDPLVRVVDLNVGERQQVRLHNGSTARIGLLSHDDIRDPVRQAVRSASVRVDVNGREATVHCSNYRLPITVAGVQIDCTVTRGYLDNARSNPWGLEKDARLRLWPAGSPLLRPGSYVYPVKQRWFATDTQMANEPSFVDGSEDPARKKVYYHYGLDIGGVEGLTPVISATDGLVVVRGKAVLPAYKDSPYIEVNYDGVIVLDGRGWFHWYFHLARIDPGVTLGQRIKMGQDVGVIGKEGHAGCWSHLHYEIRSLQPSGKAGIQEGYAFLWEAYQKQFTPQIIAVARPHSFAWVGEPVVLDGASSWSRSGKIPRFEWIFTDGSRAEGPRAKRVYSRPGTYSEILKVTDSGGNVAYDFAVVQIVERQDTQRPGGRLPPTIHAAYAPTFDVRPGQPLTFAVRTCRTTYGQETWDFGDGSAPVTVKSDGCAEPRSAEGYALSRHAYARPGDYIARVERANERGEKATAHLHVRVRE